MQFITPLPFQEAIDKLDAKSIIGSQLSSSEWADVPVELRERAFFNSRVESAQLLQRMDDLVSDFLTGRKIENGTGETVLSVGSRAAFVDQMQTYLAASGIERTSGGLQDITSQARLGIIFDTQVRQSHDYGNWKQGMDPDVLDAFPASRFIRVQDVREPRQSHIQYEDQVYLKTDPIWHLVINKDFGVPWGPWGWGCGHDVEDVDRKWCETHGLLHPGQRVTPSNFGFNHGLGASMKRLAPDLVDKLRAAFGHQITIEGDTMRWTNATAPAAPAVPVPVPVPVPAPSLKPKAQSLADILAEVGLTSEAKATPEQMATLREALREASPISQKAVIKSVTGTDAAGNLSTTNLRQMVQDFLNFFPPDLVSQLPKLKIFVGKIDGNGSYLDAQVKLNYRRLLHDPQQLRQTLYHELMHWIHIEGPAGYRQVINQHFQARTAGELTKRLPNYGRNVVGLKDDWYEVYAGRIYYGHPYGGQGLEVPTRYIEWLAMPSDKMAFLWNIPSFRETMQIVLQALI